MPTEQRTLDVVVRLAELVQAGSRTVAAAESLTGGMLTSYLATGPQASMWLRGGVVAYTPEVKRHLLGISPGPVVCERAAREMATGCATLFESDIALALTGVGGPDRQDDLEPGTVWMSAHGPTYDLARQELFDGDPASICEQACYSVLSLLTDRLGDLTGL